MKALPYRMLFALGLAFSAGLTAIFGKADLDAAVLRIFTADHSSFQDATPNNGRLTRVQRPSILRPYG